MKSEKTPPPSLVQDHYTTLEVASMLGLAVRSVQLMVDRNELEAWKTPGGHRRIDAQSAEAVFSEYHLAQGTAASDEPAIGPTLTVPLNVVIVEDDQGDRANDGEFIDAEINHDTSG